MTSYEVVGCLIASGLVAAACLLRRTRAGPGGRQNRFARFVLWLAVASPLPALLLAPSDRFRLLVRGPGGAFEGIRLLSLAAASAAVVLTLVPAFKSGVANAVLVAMGALTALGVAILCIR